LPRAALGKGFAEGLRGFAESLRPSAQQPAPVVTYIYNSFILWENCSKTIYQLAVHTFNRSRLRVYLDERISFVS
jgi:hypothetical protein